MPVGRPRRLKRMKGGLKPYGMYTRKNSLNKHYECRKRPSTTFLHIYAKVSRKNTVKNQSLLKNVWPLRCIDFDGLTIYTIEQMTGREVSTIREICNEVATLLIMHLWK